MRTSIPVAVVLFAALAAHSAVAEDVPWPPEFDDDPTVATVIAQPIPERFCLSRSSRADALRAFDDALRARLERAAGAAPRFDSPAQTDGLIDRLIAARRLSLLTLMKTDAADVFFGINERGRLGVHVDASLLMAQN